jgi:NIPSNAP
MICELRIYRCMPGRKPALLPRFENETLRFSEKHGIRQAGFSTTLIGKSKLSRVWVSLKVNVRAGRGPNGLRLVYGPLACC